MKRTLLTVALGLMALIGGAQSITDSLLWYFPFSGNAMDMSGNGFHGTEMGSVSLTTDRFGNVASAYHFDGVDDYINIAHDNGYKKQLPLTFSVWVNFADSAVPQQIINTDNSTTLYAGVSVNVVNMHHGASFKKGFGTPGAGARETIQSNDTLNSNTWHHIAVVMFKADSMELYLNGIRDTNITYSGGGNTLGYTTADASIGFTYDVFGGNDQYFEGKIDEVMCWNRGLSASEISDLYNQTSASSPCNLNVSAFGVCEGNALDIEVEGTASGVEYTLYRASDSTAIDSVMGGGTVSLSTEALTTPTDYVIFAGNDVLAEGLGTSFYVPESGNYVEFGDFPLSNAEFTVEFWMKDSSTSTNFGRILYLSGAYQLALLNSGALAFYNNGTWQYPSDTSIDKNEWNHIALTVGSGQCDIYVNGNHIWNTSISGAFSSTGLVRFGQGGNASASMIVDELRVWDVARTQSEIQENMRRSLFIPAASDLMGYYTFEGQSGSGTVNNQADTLYNGYISDIDTLTSWISGLHHNRCEQAFTVDVGTAPTLSETSTVGGDIDLTVTGGNAPFTFDWDDDGTGDDDDTEDISVAASGTYNVTVTDAYGCVSTLQVSITVDGIAHNLAGNVEVYPVPAQQNLQIRLENAENASFRLINMLGEQVVSGSINNGTASVNIASLKAGVYLLEVTQSEAVAMKRIVKH